MLMAVDSLSEELNLDDVVRIWSRLLGPHGQQMERTN